MRLLLLLSFTLLLGNQLLWSQGPVISEFMALNGTILADRDGEYSDWIEIQNKSTSAVSLKGWTLTDNRNKPEKWTLPDVMLEGSGFIIIFASGKDRAVAGSELHTNFRLDASGEYLALVNPDGKIITEFKDSYPVQKEDVSFGFLDGLKPDYLDPSPGAVNKYLWGDEIPRPSFSTSHGIYDYPFDLSIAGSVSGSKIYYTIDGSEPGSDDYLYEGLLNISSNSIIRAVEIAEGRKPSAVSTSTYLFFEDILNQPDYPDGYPLQWGPFTGIKGIAPADYGMDPEITGPEENKSLLRNAFSFLPVISIVTSKDFLFSAVNDADSGGIYIYTGPPLTNTTNGTGSGWERPASVEMFNSSGTLSFMADCGLKIHGGHSRRAEKSPKHSFRLVFRNTYGSESLNIPLFGEKALQGYNEIVLRAGFNNSWVHHSNSERVGAQYIADAWAKETHRRMGHESMHGFFAHLFINGLYWGIYNPSERPDEELFAACFGGEPGDLDIIKDYAEVANGTIEEWSRLVLMANAGLSTNISYQRIQGKNSTGEYDPALRPMVDAESLADYMILNMYAGNTDWDHHNWVAARNRINPGKGFRFFVWDAEKILEDPNIYMLNENNDNRPSRIFQQLMKNQEYKRLFADRIQKHCFENGPLTASSAAGLYEELSGTVSKALIAESARWGDYRRDVHQYQSAGPFDLYTYNNHWLPRYEYMLDTYFPARTDIFISQLREKGWFPSLDAPRYYINGESVINDRINKNDILTMESDAPDIYYTIDGSDPVIWQPEIRINPLARKYKESLVLSKTTHIRSRVYHDGEWSALNDRYFIVPEEYQNLKITELNYFPRSKAGFDDRETEFIELKNTGTTTLPLENFYFSEGVRYRFGEGSEIASGEIIVLSSNPAVFNEEYGFYPFGLYSGHLENEGERVTLNGPEGEVITSVNYSSSGYWPWETSGGGKSLVPLSLNPEGDQDSSAYWRCSYLYGGSPGKDDVFNPELQPGLIQNDIIILMPPYPNPARDYAYLPYRLLKDSYIELSVYTITGNLVEILYEGNKPAGDYVDIWSPLSSSGTGRYMAGMYIYRLKASSGAYTGELKGKIIFTK